MLLGPAAERQLAATHLVIVFVDVLVQLVQCHQAVDLSGVILFGEKIKIAVRLVGEGYDEGQSSGRKLPGS